MANSRSSAPKTPGREKFPASPSHLALKSVPSQVAIFDASLPGVSHPKESTTEPPPENSDSVQVVVKDVGDMVRAQKLDQREEESAATSRNKLSPEEEDKLKKLAENVDRDTGVTTLMLACRLPATYQARHLISLAIITFSPV